MTSITPTQMEALHDVVEGRRAKNVATTKALVAKGLVEWANAAGYGRTPDRWTPTRITEAGQTAHDAFYTPERAAAEAAAAEAEKVARAKALMERADRLQAEADTRNAAGRRLAELLGDTPIAYPFSSLVGEQNARPPNDLSGVSGGDTFTRSLTSTQLLAFAEAVLAARGGAR
jgi:hypothetical protein